MRPRWSGGTIEEGKGAGGDHRPLRGAGQLSGGRRVSRLRSQDRQALRGAGRRAGPVRADPAAGAGDRRLPWADRRVGRADAGRITARRLLRLLRAAGYEGSERSLRRAVREEKRAFREREAREGRVFRPWRSGPGEWLICDWGQAGTVETHVLQLDLTAHRGEVGRARAVEDLRALVEQLEDLPFRGSIAQPARTTVNASPAPSRTPTHDSRPSWSLRLRRRALSSPTPCRFIPALHEPGPPPLS